METRSEDKIKQIVESLKNRSGNFLLSYITEADGFALDLNQYFNNNIHNYTVKHKGLSGNYFSKNYTDLRKNLESIDPIYIELMISMIEDQKQFTVLTEKSIPITLSTVAIYISSASLLNSVEKNASSLSDFLKVFGCLLIFGSMWIIFKTLRLNSKIKDTYFKNRDMDMLIVLLKKCKATAQNF